MTQPSPSARSPLLQSPTPNCNKNQHSGDPMNDKPPKSDARIGGMVATVVLILLFIFVGVFVWVAS